MERGEGAGGASNGDKVKSTGQDHPDTLTSLNNLAWTWSYQGRHDEAVKLMTECVEGLERKLGADHPNTKAALDTLSEWQDGEKLWVGLCDQ